MTMLISHSGRFYVTSYVALHCSDLLVAQDIFT